MSHVWDGNLTRTVDAASTAFACKLKICNLQDQALAVDVKIHGVSASFCGMIASISFFDKRANSRMPNPSWPQGAKDAFNAWLALLPPPTGAGSPGMCAFIYKAVIHSGMTLSNTIYVCCGWVMNKGVVGWYGITEWEIPCSFSIENLVVKGRVGTTAKNNRANVRGINDRLAQYILCAEEETVITCNFGDLTLSRTYTFPEGVGPDNEEMPGTAIVGGSAGQISFVFNIPDAMRTDTDYTVVSDVETSIENKSLISDRINFWYNGTNWTPAWEAPTGTYFHLGVYNDAISLRRFAYGPNPFQRNCAVTLTAQMLGPVRWHISAAQFAIESGFEIEEGVMALSETAKNVMLDSIFQNDIYVSLHNAPPGTEGDGELSENGYFRQLVQFQPASGGLVTNADLVTFGPAVDNAWDNVTYYGFWSSYQGGIFYGFTGMQHPYSVPVDSKAIFTSGSMVVRLL